MEHSAHIRPKYDIPMQRDRGWAHLHQRAGSVRELAKPGVNFTTSNCFDFYHTFCLTHCLPLYGDAGTHFSWCCSTTDIAQEHLQTMCSSCDGAQCSTRYWMGSTASALGEYHTTSAVVEPVTVGDRLLTGLGCTARRNHRYQCLTHSHCSPSPVVEAAFMKWSFVII